jgi:CubicO group peptidase (beta-lactamase class C family)
LIQFGGRRRSLRSLTGAALTLSLLIGHGVGATEAGQAAQAPGASLHSAALEGDVSAVRRLIEAGADLNEKDAYGSTPLIIATTFGKTGVARALIEAGADLTIGNAEESTPLHLAAFFGRTEIVEALLKNGADRHARNVTGATPFDIAAAPFADDRAIYDRIGAALGPLGLELDYARITTARAKIAQMLRPSAEALEAVAYAPRADGDWKVSTPAEQGLDPGLVAELYLDAEEMDNPYGLLVIKNGYLVAEGYFNEGAIEKKALLQSVTKSYVSALVGIALDQGCLSSVDQKMVEFFPDVAKGIEDPRKRQITIRDMLQMRAGYPWEESDPAYWDALLTGSYVRLIKDFPLVSDPGTAFHYSNMTSHWLGIIVARACGTDLKSFAEEHLFAPLGAEEGDWLQDVDGYYIGLGELRFTARDAAKFGLLYLDGGVYEGRRIVPADWVRESLQAYTEDARLTNAGANKVGRYFRDMGYGYQWWSARVGDHHFDFAWGHGGQLIVLLDALDMILVVTAKPFYQQHDADSWRYERGIFNLVGKFIGFLPAEGSR